jgi:hypothetical protein
MAQRGAGVFGRLFPSSLSLFPLPKEAGTVSADAYDTQFSSIITGVINQISQIPSVRVPRNLSTGASKALFALFGRYQLDTSGASSTHPALDTFRRLTDKYVFDTYGAENICELGPSLTRIAARQDQCAAHNCSPRVDARDRSREIIGAQIVAKNPNHPHMQDLLARGNGQYPNPIWMCNNLGQNCQVQARVLYSSFSLQDDTPATLVQAMRSHGASVAIVNIEVPIGLDYVDSFQEVDTGAMWKVVGEPGQERAQCNPGFGDAGYTHDLARLKTWMSGFQDYPLFAEVLFQFGSALCFRFTLAGDEAGSSNYPMLVRTMLDKYSFIPGDVAGIPDFITSASHYDRLTRYLTTHHDKFAANLFKAALERVSVLTPAIVLGDDKFTDRWVLTTDQCISVAMAAAVDVQKMMHRSALGQRRLDAINSELATSARRAEAAAEPGMAGRVFAYLRNEQTITSQRTITDWLADLVDDRSARTLAQTTALPHHIQIENGTNGIALGAPVQVAPPPADQAARAPPNYVNFVPARIGYPQIDQAWPILGEPWIVAQNGTPARRGGRLINVFDPAQNQVNALAGINGLAVNALSMVQQRAVNNWEWDPQTTLDLLIIGPAGTGKSTHARRIAPAGACVIVPTNELQAHWQAVYPGHAVFTLDEAVANIHLVRASTGIIIDEVYQFPAGHVITLASLNIPTIALGSPDQRRYNGILGARFSHDIIPVDHMVLCHTIHRFGQDITNIVNNVALPIYRQELGPAIMPNFLFQTVNPGVNNIQVANAQRPGLHLTFHRANTNIFNGTMTIDASQGTDSDNVYIHCFPNDEAAFAQNPYAFALALTRARQTVTITVPAGTRNQAPLIQALVRRGLRPNQIVRRGVTVFGSRNDPVSHAFTSMDDLDHAEADIPENFNADKEVIATHMSYAGRPIVVEEDDEDADDTPCLGIITPGLVEALYALHPEPPQPADLTRDKTMIRFRKPDPAVRIRVPEWIQSLDLHEPTLYSHIGYPFSNTEVLASVLAVFDRYTKPQNVAIPNKRAFMLADIMFDRWVSAFIRPDAVVKVPSVASMFSHWFGNAKALRIAQIAEELPFIDSGRPLQNEYFLKCQCKPKFKAFGFCAECGQGILATNKLLNATICPLIVQATKIMQSMLKGGVIYDSGYSGTQLDDAVRATGQHKAKECMSIDLSQQDSSHVNVHRFFIGKVLAFLGFDDTIVSLYLMTRAKRFCKGLTMLGLLFEVIERLFSGEPGTALFNFLMSTGTSVCTFDFSKFELFIGKGDDNTVVPVLPRLKSAINMVKETGVTQKISILPYLDFANRIFTSTGRSFMDPARALAKYTMRMSKRENSVNECIAFQDHMLVCNELEHEELTNALVAKHGIEHVHAHDIVSAVNDLSRPATYYANLRPSKVPVEFMPAIRQSGRYDVVFEDLRDRCAPAAIAFIADVPIEDVMNYVAQLRLRYHVHPDIRAADRNSRHTHAFHMSADEILRAATKFGVRRTGSDLSLKIEGHHVVVVRGKFSWHKQLGKGIFGSLRQLTLLSIVCIIAAYVYENRKWMIAKVVKRVEEIIASVQFYILVYLRLFGPVVNVLLCLPTVFSLYIGFSFEATAWLFLATQLAFRTLVLPFHFRSVKTSGYKRVVSARVEHAAYGTASGTSFKIHKAFISLGLFVIWFYLMWLVFTDVQELINLTHDATKVADEFILAIVFISFTCLRALILHEYYTMSLLMSFLGAACFRRKIYFWQLYIAVVMGIFADWLLGHDLRWHVLSIVIGLLCSDYYMPLAEFFWVNKRGIVNAIAFLYIWHKSLSEALPFVRAWADDGKEKWHDWLASNAGVMGDQRFKSRSRQWARPAWTRWHFWFKDEDPVEQYMDSCVRTVFEKRGKANRDLMKLCHPDRVRNIPEICKQALGTMMGTGMQNRPVECK